MTFRTANLFQGWTRVVNNKLYAVGGYQGTSVLEYDPVTNIWTTKADMLTSRYGVGIGIIDDKLYTIGGNGLGGLLSVVEVYDPKTDTWETKASLPEPTERIGVGVINDKIYTVGGDVIMMVGHRIHLSMIPHPIHGHEKQI